MELNVDKSALAGQDIDPAAFQRVWGRVAPSQGAPSPASGTAPRVTIPDTAVPAQPSISPGEAAAAEAPELAPVPNCPDLSTLPNIPDCPAQQECPACPECPSCPDCPALPAVPDCPAEPTLPSVPDCPAGSALPSVPDCLDCPACPPCPSRPACPSRPQFPSRPRALADRQEPALCLGKASQGDSGQLESLMVLARTGALAGQALSRRASGICAKTLSALAQDHRSAFRRLSAAYFLINGKRFSPKCPPLDLPASLPLALRQQFVWEQQWERQNSQAAQATSDPCLKELYLELAQEGALHAGTIRSILEQMA